MRIDGNPAMFSMGPSGVRLRCVLKLVGATSGVGGPLMGSVGCSCGSILVAQGSPKPVEAQFQTVVIGVRLGSASAGDRRGNCRP